MKLDKEYWGDVVGKLVDNLLSIKWWMICLVFLGTGKLLMLGLLTGGEFITINTSLLGIVMAMREIFKISRIKSDEDTTNMKN